MFLSKEQILKSFPFSFRGNQEWALNQVADALNREDIQYVVIQAPTGAGKSPIGMSLARSSLNSYILTSNKLLQDQYMRDFADDLNDLRGRSNYKCRKSPGFNCAGAPCRGTPSGRAICGKEKACEYHDALDDAVNGASTSLNFAAAIAFFNFTPYFKERRILVIDEAHLIPDNLTNFVEFSVSGSHLSKLLPYGIGDVATIPKFDTAKEYLPWLSIIKGHMEKREKEFTAPAKVDIATGTAIKFEDIEHFNRKLEKIFTEITEFNDNLVVDHTFADVNQHVVDRISFKPVDVSRYAHQNLFRFGEKVIMMSATIINYKEFIKSLGIEESKCVFIDIPSTFPKENRPIIRNYVGTLNRGNMQALMPNIIQSVRDILNNHDSEKGIIHTHTYDTAKKIFFALNKEYPGRLLFPENSQKQADLLAWHASTKTPTVLLSPSMTEGVDLKDDLSRFQVLVKVPYPSMGDKVVQARMARNPEWYGWRTLLTVVQAYGRSVRSEADSAVTYVLDGAFDVLVNRYKKSLPPWFTEAIL